jgi:hypothetical protein
MELPEGDDDEFWEIPKSPNYIVFVACET